MKIQAGYLYHIKDDFFDKKNGKELMINYGLFLLVLIFLNTKKIIDKKVKKYGNL